MPEAGSCCERAFGSLGNTGGYVVPGFSLAAAFWAASAVFEASGGPYAGDGFAGEGPLEPDAGFAGYY